MGVDPCEWRGAFESAEVNRLHLEAFGARGHPEPDRPWFELTAKHSLGWVVARRAGVLVGFANLAWDGLVHAWIQDLMVAREARHQGVGQALVAVAAEGARSAGCEWLHVDFEDGLQRFYVEACGFRPTTGGLMELQEEA